VRLLLTAMGLFAMLGCSTPPGQLGKLDLEKWRNDRSACLGIRSGLVADFKAEQNQLLGKFADEIGELLGKPDIHQLGDRNQKFYVYFLEKGEQCEDIKMKSTAQKVILRFNAVGLLSEITYQKEPLSQL
jgi:outer membrane protein assembly factor BamE (lipoprotein component of BamABCDE complex)